MESEQRGLLVVAIVGVAFLGLAVLPQAGASLTWDVIAEYELNDDGTNVTDHGLTGTYSSTIACSGTWEKVADNNFDTPSDENFIKWKISYTRLQVESEKQLNNSVDQERWECSEGSLQTADLTQEWVGTVNENLPDGASCHDQREKTVGHAPNGDFDKRFTAEEDDAGICLKGQAAGAANTGNVPYTGRARMKVVNEDDEFVVSVETKDTIYGVVWGVGDSGSNGPWSDRQCSPGIFSSCTWNHIGESKSPLGFGDPSDSVGDYRGIVTVDDS